MSGRHRICTSNLGRTIGHAGVGEFARRVPAENLREEIGDLEHRAIAVSRGTFPQ
jgi:hypothetical protein